MTLILVSQNEFSFVVKKKMSLNNHRAIQKAYDIHKIKHLNFVFPFEP